MRCRTTTCRVSARRRRIPDTNEYSGFLQDTIRVTDHFALSLGARYDLQTFTTKGLQSNPAVAGCRQACRSTPTTSRRAWVWHTPLGDQRPLVIRAGYGLFYTRIPQIYTSTIQSENGLAGNFLFLNNNNFFDHQVFPQYPNPLVSCPVTCHELPAAAGPGATRAGGCFLRFRTISRLRECNRPASTRARGGASHLAVGVSYMYVHGVDLIRARDVNLPPPVNVSYPVYDASGTNFLGTYYNVASFSTSSPRGR